MLAITCPGQGAQTPGFLQPWLDVDGVAERLGWLSAVSGVDLLTHGTTSDADTIRDTAIAQPLIVAAALAVAPAILGGAGGPTGSGGSTGAAPADAVVAGHSVGEFAAAALAGVLSAEQAIVLVRERGRAMAAASAVTPTGMSAVVGGDPTEVSEVIEKFGLTAANVNGSGQVVAAGTLEQLAELAAAPPARARVIPLQVAGAFHTHHMAPAVDVLAQLAAAVTPAAPTARLLSNADGAVLDSPTQALGRLVTQVSNPVRWDRCLQTLADLGVTALIELPPAGTLVGLAKRALPGVELLAVKTPDDLDAARDLVARHSGATAAAASGAIA
ncbi:MAG: ACP S-malonyltransferase [Kineosporiaceae bacterium]|nr:ACP S-malonyltransferase [Kineosporiaceae bacterium]MBK7624390.1 ACP S-malonyltransferase [Kineosporiaceae bacterium]MBK8077758.1 ACP S-malonyltransferase [Kineosporiaceae bacterium]